MNYPRIVIHYQQMYTMYAYSRNFLDHQITATKQNSSVLCVLSTYLIILCHPGLYSLVNFLMMAPSDIQRVRRVKLRFRQSVSIQPRNLPMNKLRLKDEPEATELGLDSNSHFYSSSIHNPPVSFPQSQLQKLSSKGIICIISPCCHHRSTNTKIPPATFLPMPLARKALFCSCFLPVWKLTDQKRLLSSVYMEILVKLPPPDHLGNPQ